MNANISERLSIRNHNTLPNKNSGCVGDDPLDFRMWQVHKGSVMAKSDAAKDPEFQKVVKHFLITPQPHKRLIKKT